jgi:hypothetical protein
MKKETIIYNDSDEQLTKGAMILSEESLRKDWDSEEDKIWNN